MNPLSITVYGVMGNDKFPKGESEEDRLLYFLFFSLRYSASLHCVRGQASAVILSSQKSLIDSCLCAILSFIISRVCGG
jgi:hypothetical protein